MTAKRDTTSTCPHCGQAFKQDGIGRTRLFCSDACKTAACRQRKRSAARTALVDASYLDDKIGQLTALGEHTAAETLRQLAADFHMVLDAKRIATAQRAENDSRAAMEAFMQWAGEKRNMASVTK
jgi:predicted nucleic acid-binding Zn ribbon protein